MTMCTSCCCAGGYYSVVMRVVSVHRLAAALCLAGCMLLTLPPAAGAARWAHSAMLNPDYRLLWSLGPGPQDITFELQVRTLGYVGFGLSRDGRMAGSDMVVGWVDRGQVYFQDRHVKASPGAGNEREPEVDPSQDYQLLLGYENRTHTVLRFRRRLDTCDPHDIPITNDTVRVLWAMHPEEPAGGGVGVGTLPPHTEGSRGSQSLYLVQRVNQEAPGAEESAQIWELRNSKVELPLPGDTLYWCKVFKPPDLPSKHHLIRYEPLLEGAGEQNLQHAVLYECQDNEELSRLAGQRGRACYEPNSPPLACSAVVATWARGSEGFSFPPEAGYPLEKGSARYYMLESHYATPLEMSLNSGLTDSSGLRLYYTPELRRHDAGVLSVGIDPNWRHIIPPGQPRVVSSGHCVSECTSQAFPKGGINMFAVVMRTHRIGKQVRLRQVRGGTEQAPVSADDNLDSEYQEYRRLSSPVKVLPGDHLIAECTYNSSERTAITLGGLTGREETCLVLALYYPRQRQLTVCHSLPSLPTVLHSLGIQELHSGSNPLRISAPPELAGMTLESRLVTYDWENQFHSFQDATIKGSFKPLCWSASSTILPGTEYMEAHYPNITRPYRGPADQCRQHARRPPPEPSLAGRPPPAELDGNHIEGAARSKVSRSSTAGHAEQPLGLSNGPSLRPTLVTLTTLIIVLWHQL